MHVGGPADKGESATLSLALLLAGCLKGTTGPPSPSLRGAGCIVGVIRMTPQVPCVVMLNTNIAVRVLVADDLHFHWRRADGVAVCGTTGMVMPVDMAVNAGYHQCGRCHLLLTDS